ncbi:MAG: hypothetical protein HY584_04775 [Candidatus Omnitrophica bacterium]|nr:hypothetical protein [Candidatus Omnitrophota bacterium]
MKQIKYFIFIFFFALTAGNRMALAADPADDDSLGVRAGKTVNQVRDTTETTYVAASEQTQVTAKEIEASWDKFAESLRKQWDEAVKNVQVATENFRAYLNREYVKFMETVNSPKQS